MDGFTFPRMSSHPDSSGRESAGAGGDAGMESRRGGLSEAAATSSEVMRRGDPDLRPEQVRMVVSRTPAMEDLKKKLEDCALLVTILPGAELPPRRVTIRNVLDAIMPKCGIEDGISCKVSSPPADSLFRFNRAEDCTAALKYSMQLEVNGCTVKFDRWTRTYRGEESVLPFCTVFSLDGLPEDAYERGFVEKIVNQLGGEFVEYLTLVDLRCVRLQAWVRDPWKLPKKVRLEVPEPFRSTIPQVDDEDIEVSIEQSLAAPATPLSRRTYIFDVMVHLHKVVDHYPNLPHGGATRFNIFFLFLSSIFIFSLLLSCVLIFLF
ncbi:hypothetical protein BRADI_2g16090v3 [Brachypodium distachyon]|uniref:DUF4283 domain-containing protein n=1 Tax=Brachypodium distachyon TaxID=15368 RepID=A0A0Q3K248_BRADI|nr:hypothetical protein BRADI_2g16090v3 [Brachypodium distachyon]